MKYLLDSNALISPKNGYYSFDRCPGFWIWLLDMHNQKIVGSVYHIGKELSERDDELSDWLKKKAPPSFLAPVTEETGANMRKIADWVMKTNRYEPEAKAAFLGKADSFIIAHAMELGATVVTFERRENGRGNIKIPNVCDEFKVKCCNLFQFMGNYSPQFNLLRKPI